MKQKQLKHDCNNIYIYMLNPYIMYNIYNIYNKKYYII